MKSYIRCLAGKRKAQQVPTGQCDELTAKNPYSFGAIFNPFKSDPGPQRSAGCWIPQ